MRSISSQKSFVFLWLDAYEKDVRFLEEISLLQPPKASHDHWKKRVTIFPPDRISHDIMCQLSLLYGTLASKGMIVHFSCAQEDVMATNPQREGSQRSGWPGKGKIMTEDAYHELERLSPDRKYEYINGIAYMMSGGSVAHDRITRNIGSALDRQFRSGPCTVFGVDVQVLIGTKRNGKPHYVYPDATVSCDRADRRPDNTLITSPRLVVEVLSPGTEVRDRGIKMKAYQQCPTIQEIVLVSQFAQYVEVWQRNEQEPDNPKGWSYRHYGPGDTINFSSIAVQIAIGEFYRGLEFDEGEFEDE